MTNDSIGKSNLSNRYAYFIAKTIKNMQEASIVDCNETTLNQTIEKINYEIFTYHDLLEETNTTRQTINDNNFDFSHPYDIVKDIISSRQSVKFLKYLQQNSVFVYKSEDRLFILKKIREKEQFVCQSLN